MVWVILGAIAPFITTDALLTGANLRVTPSALISKAAPYTLVVKGPQTVKQNPKLKADQPKSVYNLLIKAGTPATIKPSDKPVEKFVVDNSVPATIAAVNAKSKFIQIAQAPGASGNPYDNVIGLQPMAALAKAGKAFQPVANGYPPSTALKLLAIPLLAAGFWRILLGLLSDKHGSKRVGVASMALTLLPLAVGWQLAGHVQLAGLCRHLLGAGRSVVCGRPTAGVALVSPSPARAGDGHCRSRELRKPCWRRSLPRCWQKPTAGTRCLAS